ncbi:porin [Hydrogenophaga sp.]|uniref:porin n=1 Tax=Hydrogenophaga sp. TaxID=1904254 RepID=UPI003F6EB5B2
MKKTMIALAAFGALAGAAHAQSSVTLYGLLDMYVGEGTTKTTVGAVTVKTKPGTGLTSGGLSGSRWGLRGAEDLGGGLKATFQLEAGINADDGTVGAGFNRTSKMGLSGGFGSVEFGRQYTPMFLLMDGFDAQATSSFSATSAVGGPSGVAGLMGVTTRWDNSVLYTSPNMGGFSVGAQYAFGENATPAASAGRALALTASFATGPIAVQGVYQTEKANGAAATAKSTGIGASYDFSVVKVLGQFINQNDGVANGQRENAYVLSVAVPLGAAGSLAAGFGNERIKVAGTKVASTDSFGVEYIYNLSKRTNVYAGLTNVKLKNAAGTASTQDQLYGFGMRHKF